MTALGAPVDGRTARAVRTRAAIVDAFLALVEDGDVAPTAARTAARARVSARSIYQHFADMESLYRAASARQLERVLGMYEAIPVGLPVVQRVERFVGQRSRILEAITPLRRAALLQEHTSHELAASRDRFVALGQAEVRAVFAPELEGLRPAERRNLFAALDTAASWNCWDWMRTTGRAIPAASQVMRTTLIALLARVG